MHVRIVLLYMYTHLLKIFINRDGFYFLNVNYTLKYFYVNFYFILLQPYRTFVNALYKVVEGFVAYSYLGTMMIVFYILVCWP